MLKVAAGISFSEICLAKTLLLRGRLPRRQTARLSNWPPNKAHFGNYWDWAGDPRLAEARPKSYLVSVPRSTEVRADLFLHLTAIEYRAPVLITPHRDQRTSPAPRISLGLPE